MRQLNLLLIFSATLTTVFRFLGDAELSLASTLWCLFVLSPYVSIVYFFVQTRTKDIGASSFRLLNIMMFVVPIIGLAVFVVMVDPSHGLQNVLTLLAAGFQWLVILLFTMLIGMTSK